MSVGVLLFSLFFLIGWMINGIILYLKSSNTGNWTSRWDVGVAFAGKVRLFFLFFCLKLGLRESVFVVRSPPYPREGISDV